MADEVFTTDVLVIGAGNAGLRAAVGAAEKGARTLLVSKSPFPGGSSVVAGGIRQAAFHPDDSPDLHFSDTLKSGKYLNNQRLVRLFVQEAPKRILDLEEYGVMLVRTGPREYRIKLTGGGSAPRGLHTRRNDRVMRLVLERALRLGVELFDQTMVTRLVQDDRGAVAGAVALDIIRGRTILILARSVVLAAGALARIYSRNATVRNATGDGLALAARAGTTFIDMEFVQFIPLGYVGTFIDGMTLGEGSVWGEEVRFLNGSGERYLERYAPGITEYRATRDILARANYSEILAGRGTANSAVLVDATRSDPNEVEFSPKAMAHRYRLLRDFYGKAKADLKEPLEAAPSALYICGGVEFDEECATNIPGLYVCGEMAGGIHGANRLNGNSLIDCEVFGKIAGESAARYSREEARSSSSGAMAQALDEERRILDLMDRPVGEKRPRDFKRSLQNIMWQKVGIVRNGPTLAEAVQEIENLRDRLPELSVATPARRYNLELVEALEVPMMVQVADMVARCALFRTESRGNHYRLDYPNTDNESWLANTHITVEGERLRLEKRPVELLEVDPRQQ